MKKVIELIIQEIKHLNSRIESLYDESDDLRENSSMLHANGVNIESKEDTLYEERNSIQEEIDELEANLVKILEL